MNENYHYVCWENLQNQRYYFCLLERDLFGDIILTKVNGGLNNSRGMIKRQLCDSFTAGENLLKKMAEYREKRGYQVVKSCGD